MHPLVIELRRNIGVFMFPVAFGLHLLASLRWVPAGTAVWVNASSAVAMGSVLSGPFVAAVAAWSGSRERRSGTGFLRVASARAGWRGPSLEVAALMLWALAAYWLVAVVLLVKTAAGATWGGPDLVWMLSGCCGVVVFVVLGYVAGRAVPRAYTPPIVGVAGYLAVALNARGSAPGLYFLSPTIMQRVTPFLAMNDRLLLLQTLWYVALSVAAFGVLSVVVLRVKTPAVVAITLAAALVAVVAAVPVSRSSSLFAGPSAFTYVCNGGSVSVCVHPAFSAGLPGLAEEFDQLAVRVDGTPFAVGRLEQRPRGWGRPPSGVGWFAFDDLHPGFAHAAVVEYVGTTVVPGLACLDKAGRGGGPDDGLIVLAVRAWLADDLSSLDAVPPAARAAASHLASLSTAQGRAWLNAHAGGITHCTLTWGDLT